MKVATCETSDLDDGSEAPCPNKGYGYVWDDVAAQQQAEANGLAFAGIIYCGPCGRAMTNTDAPADAQAGTFIPPDEQSPATEP